MASTGERQRIAVVGSGLTGLAAAWILGEHHDVTLFERAPALGMGAYGVPIPMADGSVANIDVPLRVLSTSYYHFLFELYSEAGIPVQGEDYSLSFAHLASGSVSAAFWHNTLLRVAGYSTPLPKLDSLEAWSATAAFARLLHLCKTQAGDAALAGVTFGAWLDSNGVTAWEKEHLVLPLLSVILTCDHNAIEAYPAGIVVGYMGSGNGESVRRAVGGSTTVCERLSRRATVRLNARIAAVHASEGAGQLARVVMEDGSSADFHAVVLATQANVARRLLAGGSHPRPDLLDALGSFDYCKTHIVCHTDARVMPPQRAEWRTVNFAVSPTASRSMATIHMNALLPSMRMSSQGAAEVAARFRAEQATGACDWDAGGDEGAPGAASAAAAERDAGEAPPPSLRPDGSVDVFQTLNPLVPPHPASVISECWADRPVLGLPSVAAFDTIASAQGVGGVYLCGSYSVYGMPLLEGAVESAVRVCKALGVEAPFWKRALAQRSARHATPSCGGVRCALCLPSLQLLILAALVAIACLLAVGWWALAL